MFPGRRSHEMNDRQGQLPLLDIDPKCFADGVGLANDVEDVILNLEGSPHRQTEQFKTGDQVLARAGISSTEGAAACAQYSRLEGDDLQVGFLVQIELVPVLDLEQLTFADLVGR